MEDYHSNGSSDDECYDRVYDDYDDDDTLEEPEVQTDSPFPRREGPSAKIIRKESLLAAQKECLSRVMDLLSLREHHARTLLIHYRWDIDKIVALYVDRGQEWLYAQAGLAAEGSECISSGEASNDLTCQICFEEVTANESTAMECGHCFCNNCWTEHFTVMITEGKSRRITCMAYKCSAICDEEKIRNLVGLSDSHLAEKFDRFLLESYIDDNERVKWCPSVPHCGNAIHIDDDEVYEVECACGVQFCFSCSSEPHSPCSCMMWKLWMVKCQDESETINWITVNTKYCPKCVKPVEKNGGCNLVTCICGQYFCWLCGAATGAEHTWDSISGHTCGRYKEDELKKTEQAAKELHRYSHYYNRYKAHIDSLTLEADTKDKLNGKISSMQKHSHFASEDFSWVPNGLSRLYRSRRTLAYSYVFAYYMFGDILFKDEMTLKEKEIKQNLFEDQQQQFELNVERLSKCLEEPVDAYSVEEVTKIRLKIIALSTVTDNLCKKMYECIENDLLAPLQNSSHVIAPYRPNSVEKASEL